MHHTNARQYRVRSAALATMIAAGMLLVGCSSPGGAAPKGVPAEVVTVEGDVSSVANPSEKNWTYSVTVPDAKAQQSAIDALVDDGFTLDASGDNELGSNHSLSKDDLNVTLSLQQQDKTFTVVYNVLQQ